MRESVKMNITAGGQLRRGEEFNGYDGRFRMSRLTRNRAVRLTHEDPRSL
jgi:hypothetical protein